MKGVSSNGPGFGEPVPRFAAPGVSNPRYVFDTAAGRYLVLAIVQAGPGVDAAIRALEGRRRLFDDVRASAFVLIVGDDPHRLTRKDGLPGLRFLFDPDGSIAALYGAATNDIWFLVDPALHILAIGKSDQAERMLDRLAQLPVPARHSGSDGVAPILITPRIFEPGFCEILMTLYRDTGGTASGFMREIDGMTTLIMDENHKRRSDVIVEDEGLQKQIMARLQKRLVPQISKAFNFLPTRIERYLVARYDAETGGFFRPHRDNTTKGTAHRRFAVSINLNGDYDGGDLRFPEFGDRTYRPPPGGACVFSCSVLHEATPVTRGERFAFLPFLYDEAAAAIRQANLKYLDPVVSA